MCEVDTFKLHTGVCVYLGSLCRLHSLSSADRNKVINCLSEGRCVHNLAMNANVFEGAQLMSFYSFFCLINMGLKMDLC